MFDGAAFGVRCALAVQKAYRTDSDAAVGPAAVLMLGSLGGLVGPNLYGSTSSNGRTYETGHFAMSSVFAAAAALAVVMRCVLCV